jgi:class 3 adenylate cyclase/tetratricopeptide (TPR) repeat protein
VTVLFADLAGSTALGELIDPEDVRELQSELFELVNTEVERYGGTTQKFAGDAVVAVFGIPSAHEDDAERAVRAGLAVQDRFGSFIESVQGRHGADVGLRIGVNTGDVVAGRDLASKGELMVSGDAVNVAARLQQHAEPGEVLVGQRTQAASGRSIEYRRRADVEAKGKRDPVPAWVAVAVTAEPVSAPRGVGGLTAPLVGRNEELAILSAVGVRVERERAPQLVTLFGPAGVGKSRLLSELLERLPAGRVLKGRCLPYGEGITYWPLAEVAKAHAGILDTDPAEVALTKLRSAIESVVPNEHAERALDAAAWTIGFSLPGLPVMDSDPREAVRRLEEGWARYVSSLGDDRLAVIAVEDVHWASAPLLDLLERLAERLENTQVLLVCTARLELLELRPSWGAGKLNATTLSLAPLSHGEAAELVSLLLGEANVPETIRERILGNAEGNPFFLEEMLNMLIEQGALERRNGGWVSTERLEDVSIPDSVHGVIAARIDLLEAPAREALRRCAVVGRIFWPEAVGVDEEEISSLIRTGLVSARPESVMGGRREFGFKHALTRDVAYTTLPRPERRDLHRLVADWLQEVAPDRGVETAELTAYHYGRALEYGETDPEVSRRAFESLLIASEAAFSRGAFDAATAQVTRAVELSGDDRQRVVAELALARLDYTDGAFEAALERLESLQPLLRDSEAGIRSDVLALRSRVSWIWGHWDQALTSANDAVAALAGLPESPQLARALARLSQIEMLKHLPGASEHAREAVEVAERVGDAFAEVNARINLFTERATFGVAPDTDDLLEIVDRAVEAGVYEEAYRSIVNFIWSAPGYLPLGRIEAAIAEARLRADVAPPAAIGPYLELSIAFVLLVPAGRWAEIDEDIIAGADEMSVGPPTARMVWLGVVAGLALRRGDLTAAEPLVDQLVSLALATGEPQRIVPMACIALPYLLLTGKRDELRGLTERTLSALDARWPSVLTTVPVARALAAAGEPELLARVTESQRRAPSDSIAAVLEISLTAADGLSRLLEDRSGDAVALLTIVSQRLHELGHEYEAACLDLDLARALEAAGNEGAAEDLRARSAAVLEPLRCVNPF